MTFLDAPKTDDGATWWYVGGAVIAAGAAAVAVVLFMDDSGDAQGLQVDEIQGGAPP